ncbi:MULTISPECIES: hypothetical protein [unclassified Tatumella]|uniref:hypothetical protein n=1 Tax=unclassified Tatumella TaxID=2649542 RepID=UPI001BAE7E59|nr:MULTISPECIES: hypothetical protein [unclassified Tatumella]MBS0855337.1 hypothetical protein [Tatumella sp. JGM16]MBS0894114.1 hypothetical protein [Tatumella sp. JGM130]MBS0911571.1 hypothetical protein [Tatumella sp. JGM91]
MNQGILFSSSKKFLHILNQLTNHKILRNDLINIAIIEFQLSKKQAVGLIDRGIYQLKHQDLVQASGNVKNISYQFSLEVMSHLPVNVAYDAAQLLTSEKQGLEKELMQIHYEQEAYQEFLEKIPNKKLSIMRLQQETAEKFNQLNGKLRAINQLLAL